MISADPKGRLESSAVCWGRAEDARQDAADQFEVSEYTIRTLLVNHKRLERDELYEGFDETPTSFVAGRG